MADQQNETSDIIEQFLKKAVADLNVAPTVTTDDQYRLGDLEYRVELEPELATTPLGQLAYWDIREKSGGDVSQYIKNIMGNPETGYVMGDDPDRPMYGRSTRGRFYPATGIVRANATDLVDKFGPEASGMQSQSGGDRVMAHELGHAGIKLLEEAGRLPEGSRKFYEEDILQVLDSIGFGTREGDVAPPWKMGDLNLNYTSEGPIGTTRRTSFNRPEETHVDYARTATGVMTGELEGLTPYEQELAEYITKLNRIATEELASRRKAAAPKVEKAAGGFVEKPLYDRSPYG